MASTSFLAISSASKSGLLIDSAGGLRLPVHDAGIILIEFITFIVLFSPNS